MFKQLLASASRFLADESGLLQLVSEITIPDPANGDPVAARVVLFEPADFASATSVTIDTQPAIGHVVARADNRIAIVLSEVAYNVVGTAIEFDYTVTGGPGAGSHSFSRTTTASLQQKGWSLARDTYAHPRDTASGNIQVEHGRDYAYNVLENGSFGHRKVYCSGAPVWTEAGIVAAEPGLTDPSQITAQWLAQNPTYGSDAANSLDIPAAERLWRWLTEDKRSSHWLLLERGHSYFGFGRMLYGTAEGESPRHPLLITAYGTGTRPSVTEKVNLQAAVKANVVFAGITIDGGVNVRQTTNAEFEDCLLTGSEVDFTPCNSMTMRRCQIRDSWKSAPSNGTNWRSSNDRIAGFHFGEVPGVGTMILEDLLVDHCGWEDGYNVDYSWPGPQPPSDMSHNMYMQDDGSECRIRRLFTSRSSYTGAMMRQGGHMEDIMSLNNPVGISNQGGDYKDRGPVAWGAFLNNLINMLGSERYVTVQGTGWRLARGYNTLARDATEIDCICAHMWDINDPSAPVVLRGTTAFTFQSVGSNYLESGRIIRNWRATQPDGGYGAGDGSGDDDYGTGGLNGTTMDATTPMVWLENKVGGGQKYKEDVVNHFRALDDIQADLIDLLNFLRNGFGKSAISVSEAAATFQFDPKDYTEGMCWDMRKNWSPERVPGYASSGKDSVNLRGARVIFPYETVDLATLTFGKFGHLEMAGGRIMVDTLDTDAGGNSMQIKRIAQLDLPAYSSGNALTLDLIEGGRVVTDASITGAVSASLADEAQLVLQGSATYAPTGTTTLTGIYARLGADDTSGTVALTFGASHTLEIVDGGDVYSDVNIPISKFRSGMTGDVAQAVTFNVTLGGTLDLTGARTGTYKIISADSVTGSFASVVGGSVNVQATYVEVTV